MPLVKRRFYVPCREDECLKLYELLRDRVPSINYVLIEVTSKGLLVEAYGYEVEVKNLWVEIKKLIGPLKEITHKTGLRKYHVNLITKMIGKTFPPRLLVEVLKRMSYIVDYLDGENVVITNAPLEEVLKLSDKIAYINTEAGKVAANTSTRYYVVVSCILSGLPVEDVIRLSVNFGLLTQSENEKHILTIDWRTAVDHFLKSVKK